MAFKLPGDSRRFVQLNNSDLFGNISRSKNINLDEEGYIKLSPRTVSLVSTDDSAQFNIPVAFGRSGQSGEFFVATVEEPFDVQIDADSGVSGSEDTATGNPNLTTESHGSFWQNRWYATEDNSLHYKTTIGGNWTDASVTLASGKLHPLEVFRTSASQSLCIGNGNAVKQIDTSHSDISGQQLTIPADFEVTKLAFSNGRMGIATKLSDTASSQSGEAFFFTWDGLGASANQAVSAGTDWIFDVVAYRGTYVILTRTGLLRMWNGGGFEDLAQLPVYFTSRTWGEAVNTEGYGDLMVVDGDVIYININNRTKRYGRKGEEYISPGGIMCYDPKAGLYHRWSASISPVSRLTVTASNVNTSTDVLTTTAGTIPTTGSPVKYIERPADEIGGLKIGKIYYCIKLTSTTMQLAETREKAINNVAIDLTAQSGATSYFLALELRDYGQSHIERTGAVALHEFPDLARNQIMLGAELQDHDSTSDVEHLCFDCTEFPNIGYVVTPKLLSAAIKDHWQRGFVKHRRLKTGEKIIIKVQTEELVGLPVSTPQHGQRCTWNGTNEFSTSADFEEAKDYIDGGGELECEIIAGAGAGQVAQIESIAEDSGTYSVVLKDEIEGVSATNTCDVLIENWCIIKTVTDTDVEESGAPTGKPPSGWAKFKIIMVGSDIALYEIPVANSVNKPIV